MPKIFAFFAEALVFFALPIALMTSSGAAMSARPLIMGLAGVYVTWQIYHLRTTPPELGLRPEHWLVSLKRLAIPSLLMVAVTYLIFLLLPPALLQLIVGYDALTGFSMGSRLLFYVFLSVPVQEFIFRGYVTLRLRETFTSRPLIILISTLLFALAHLPFYSLLMLVLTLYMGWVYIVNYLRYRNLFSLMLSHAVVGSLILLIRNAYFPY